MFDGRHGYLFGCSIAIAAVGLVIYTGILFERNTAPEPCIPNLSTTSYPEFELEQIWLESDEEYTEDSDWYRHGIKTSEQLAERLVAMSQDSDHPSQIYTNQETGNRFYVPGLCYVGKVDYWGDPTLYRR